MPIIDNVERYKGASCLRDRSILREDVSTDIGMALHRTKKVISLG